MSLDIFSNDSALLTTGTSITNPSKDVDPLPCFFASSNISITFIAWSISF